VNLIEARKLAFEGWVRSPTRTDGEWTRVTAHKCASDKDLDAEDWEPKPAPKALFDEEIWIHPLRPYAYFVENDHPIADWEAKGWRRIRVREVTE
jgi:hypothetical protein